MTIFKTYFFITLCALSLLTVSSCGEDVPEDQQLMEFFEKNNITPQVTASGLFYVIDEPGTAEKPNAQSTVTVHYRGYRLNGDEFDSSYKREAPYVTPLNRVIQGWTEGIPLFGKGGKGSIYMHSNLGYGGRGNGDIAGFTPLAFDIELIDFQ